MTVPVTVTHGDRLGSHGLDSPVGCSPFIPEGFPIPSTVILGPAGRPDITRARTLLPAERQVLSVSLPLLLPSFGPQRGTNYIRKLRDFLALNGSA